MTGLPTGHLGAAHDETHLRAIAVGYQNLIALLNQIGNVFDRLPDGLMLIFDRLLIFALDQRVSADGN